MAKISGRVFPQLLPVDRVDIPLWKQNLTLRYCFATYYFFSATDVSKRQNEENLQRPMRLKPFELVMHSQCSHWILATFGINSPAITPWRKKSLSLHEMARCHSGGTENVIVIKYWQIHPTSENFKIKTRGPSWHFRCFQGVDNIKQ